MVDQYTDSFNRMFYLDNMHQSYREEAVRQLEHLVKGGKTAEAMAIIQFNLYIQNLSSHR